MLWEMQIQLDALRIQCDMRDAFYKLQEEIDWRCTLQLIRASDNDDCV